MGIYGDLADLPLQDILYVISSRGKSGQLTLQTRSHDISLVFDHGSIVSVTTSDGSLKIGQLLVSQGYVTEEQIERALGLQAINPEPSRIGDLLVDVGYVTREQIQDAVNAQLEASIFRILVQAGGTFAFTPSDSVVTDPVVRGLRLESMLLNALHRADEWSSVHDAEKSLQLADELIDSEVINELDDIERTVVMSVLNGDSTIDVIALRSGLTAPEFEVAVDRLQHRGLIELQQIASSEQQPEYAG